MAARVAQASHTLEPRKVANVPGLHVLHVPCAGVQIHMVRGQQPIRPQNHNQSMNPCGRISPVDVRPRRPPNAIPICATPQAQNKASEPRQLFATSAGSATQRLREPPGCQNETNAPSSVHFGTPWLGTNKRQCPRKPRNVLSSSRGAASRMRNGLPK